MVWIVSISRIHYGSFIEPLAPASHTFGDAQTRAQGKLSTLQTPQDTSNSTPLPSLSSPPEFTSKNNPALISQGVFPCEK